MNKIFWLLPVLCFMFLTACEDEGGPDGKAERERAHKEKCIMSKRSNHNLPECANEK